MSTTTKRQNKPFEASSKPIGIIMDEDSWKALNAIHKQSPAMNRSDIIREALKVYARSRGAM